MKQMKRIIVLTCCAIVLLCGCSLFSKKTTDQNNNETKEESVNEQKPNGQVVSAVCGTGYGDWKKAYASYIEGNDSVKKTYSLIYVDDDNILELYVCGSCEADGDGIVTYDAKKDQLSFTKFSRIGLEYIPQTGLMCKNSGHMDYYPLTIYQLYKGDVYLIAEGCYWWNGAARDVKDIVYHYEWNGAECTEEEYNKHIKEVFDTDKEMFAQESYDKDQMLNMLRQ